jgi:antirestriction protein
MERRQDIQGGETTPGLALEQPETESWDERVIREGIEAAVSEGRPIDDRTARYIASQLHSGQGSALYSLASSGAIGSTVLDELDQDRTQQEPLVRRWLACLTVYCASRPERGPVAGWVEQTEAQDRSELLGRISAAGVATLGEIATIHTPEAPGTDDFDEVDDESWIDAARWSPADDANGQQIEDRVRSAQLDELFGELAHEEVGSAQELGWYGLVKHADRPGGMVLTVDSTGFRRVWETESDEALDGRWARTQTEYEQFYAERDAYDQVTGEQQDAPSGVAPRIWVGSLADYNEGTLHGEWFDATCTSDELTLATRFMLRTSRSPDAEEWAVMDYDGFAGIDLGEYASFDVISRVAQGIAEHGEAFGHWAAYVGSESTDEIERFGDHYRGEWESFEAYVKDYLEETEFYRFLDQVPEDMRGYVEVDVEQMARDWGSDYEVVERPDGGVWVFDPRG